MRKQLKQFLSITCAFILVLSMVLPSLSIKASAEQPVLAISLDSGSEDRTITYAEGDIRLVSDPSTQLTNLNYNYETGELNSDYLNNFISTETYKIHYDIQYSENNEQYTFIDEVILTGEEITQLNQLTIPQELEKTKFDYFNVGSYSAATAMIKNSDELTEGFVFSISPNNWIVSDKSKKLPIFYSLALYDSKEEDKDAVYIIKDKLDFSVETILLKNKVEKTQKINLPEGITSPYISSIHPYYRNSVYNSTDLYVTPGEYKLTYSVDEKNWEGIVNVAENTTLNLPQVPKKVEVLNSNLNLNSYENTVDFQLETQYVAGNFKVTYYGNKPYTAKVLDSEGHTVEANVNYSYSSMNIEFLDKTMSGEYTLQLDFSYTANVLGEEKVVELPIIKVPFNYDSPWQTLQGAVVTATDTEGKQVDDLEVTLYENRGQYYNRTFSKKVDEAGEVFIPDAYLLKDQTYLLVATSASQETTYLYEFEGQSQNEIKLEPTNVKEISVKTPGDYLTQLTFQFLDENNIAIQVPHYDGMVKLQSNIPVKGYVYGIAENNEGTIGYEVNHPLDENYQLDLTKENWVKVTPSKQYKKAYLLSSYSSAKYDEYYFINRSPVQLVIEENGKRYEQYMSVYEPGELSLSDQIGQVSYATSTYISTSYYGNYGGSLWIPTNTDTFTYKITNADNESFELITNNLNGINLKNTLAPGTYKIELIDTTVDPELMNLSLNTTFEVYESTSDSGNPPVYMEDQLPETLTFNKQTAYGEISSWGNNVSIYEKNNNYNSRVGYYNSWNDYQAQAQMYGARIDANKEYIIIQRSSLISGDFVMDRKTVQGSQLLSYLSEPISYADDLLAITVDNAASTNSYPNVGISLINNYAEYTVGLYENRIKFFVPAGKLLLTNDTRDYDKRTSTNYYIFNGEITKNETFKLSDEQLIKLTASKDGKSLDIFAWPSLGGGYTWGSDLSYVNTTFETTPRTISDFMLGAVIKHSETDTPWGYMIRQQNVALTKDTNFDFSGEVTGDITNINAYTETYGDEKGTANEISQTYINAGLSVLINDLKLRSIYVASDRNALAEGTILRDYYGHFSSLNNQVPISYTIKNSKNEQVAKGVVNNSSLEYASINLNKQLASDVYTLELSIPTAPRKALKLSKEFVVGTPENVAYVSLYKYPDYVNNASINGTTNPNATVNITLYKGNEKISSKAVTADETGQFTALFEGVADGTYKAVATVKDANNVEKSATAQFNLDTTPAEAPTNVDVQETATGINVTWSPAKDAVSYRVLVKEGQDGQYQGVSVTTENTAYLIKNPAYDTTYQVLVLAVDRAGNTTPSEAKTIQTKAFIGATVKGIVSNGQPVKDAVVLLKGATNYDITTNDKGEFELTGVKPGMYNVSVKYDNETTTYLPITVVNNETKDLQTLTLNKYVSPTFTFVENGTGAKVSRELRARIENKLGFVAYGTIVNGEFVASFGSSIEKLAAGTYTVTVNAGGSYKTTKKEVTVKNNDAIEVVVDKENYQVEDITISLPAAVTKVDSLYLYSSSTNRKFPLENKGSYYKSNIKVEDNKIVVKDVVLADDYSISIAAPGYMNFSETFDLTKTQAITAQLEVGREIKGTITDNTGAKVQGVEVYAYADSTYDSTVTDQNGQYTLKNLSKSSDVTISTNHLLYAATENKIAASASNQFNIQLEKALTMEGTVVDKDGKPLANASVYIENGSGWARTDENGKFAIRGLTDGQYDVSAYLYGYPTVVVKDKKPGNIGNITLQHTTSTGYTGEGNSFNVSKEQVVPGDTIEYTLNYQKGGESNAANAPVTFNAPAGLTIIKDSVQLNGKPVAIDNGVVTIPTVKAGVQGKITFKAQVSETIEEAALTVTAKVTDKGTVQSITNSVVFATLQAPENTNTKQVKVHGTAKLGSTINIYANDQFVGQTTVDGKWWYATVELPVADSTKEEKFTLTATVTDNGLTAKAKPTTVTYSSNIPTITEATVYAGWNGHVKLNPYTGIATFAITEFTPLDTTVAFDKTVDSAKIVFLGKEYDMKKQDGSTFTFDGDKLGRWSSYGEQILYVKYKRGDVEVTVPLMNIIVLVDPSGYVFEGSMDNRLEGVQAVVEVKDADGEWVEWDAEKYGQVNPQITNEEGRYGWDVIQGEWRVIFTKEGYKPYISRVMSVPPAETELNIPMVKLGDPVVETKEVTADHLTVKFDRYVKVTDKTLKLYKVTAAGREEVAGTIQHENKNGYSAIQVPSAKATGFVEGDSNGETGFFAENTAQKVSQTFKFVPNEELAKGASYVLVVDGNTEDRQLLSLGQDVEFEIQTEGPSLLEKLLDILKSFVAGYVDQDFEQKAEKLVALNVDDTVLNKLDSAAAKTYNEVKAKLAKLKQLSYDKYEKYKPTAQKPVKPITEKKAWTITLSDKVKNTDANKKLIEIQNMFGEKVENVDIKIDGSVITVTPTGKYVPNTDYTLVINAGLESQSGVKLDKGIVYTFQFK